jgi:hypothetical protein
VPQQLLEARPAGSTWRSCHDLHCSGSLVGHLCEARKWLQCCSALARRRTGWRSIRRLLARGGSAAVWGQTACWLGLLSLSQTLSCQQSRSAEWCDRWLVAGRGRRPRFIKVATEIERPRRKPTEPRRAAQHRPLRTISGGPDAYQRCSARPDPRRRCGAPPIRTATAARPRPVRRRVGARFCVATLEKRGILPLSTHHPPLTPLSRPTLLTGQGLAQAEKPKPACSGSTQQQSLHRQEDGGSTCA